MVVYQCFRGLSPDQVGQNAWAVAQLPTPIWAPAQSANGELGANTRNPLIPLPSRNGAVAALSEAQDDQQMS